MGKFIAIFRLIKYTQSTKIKILTILNNYEKYHIVIRSQLTLNLFNSREVIATATINNKNVTTIKAAP